MRVVTRFLCVLAIMPALTACQSAKHDEVVKHGSRFADPRTEALAEAAAVGDVAKIDEELQAGAQINGRDDIGVTPLLYALYHKNWVGYHTLLERKADPNLETVSGDSVISIATLFGDADYLQEALDHGGNPNLVDDDSLRYRVPIFTAIMARSQAEVSLLIKAGADLNPMSPAGTPLMAAAAINEYEIVYTLLQAGADFSIKDNAGHTVAWYLENSKIDPKSDVHVWWEKSVEFLRQRGVEVHP